MSRNGIVCLGAAQGPYRCVFCGAASWRDPSDQDAPADYCGEADHAPWTTTRP